MGDRKKIGIIYEYNENWIGGTYYIQNLILAINTTIIDELKPILYIYTQKDEHFQQLKNITCYPFLSRGSYYTKRNIIQKLINSTCKVLLNREPYNHLNKEVEVVFPATNEGLFRPNQKFIYWIPDFQEHYLPEFFDKDEIKIRKEYQRSIISKPNNILFSSLSVQDDFNKLYPNSIVKQFVLPFAVAQPIKENFKDCRDKYKIDYEYFICCNQFWKHKNHKVVLESISILKKRGEKVNVVFTGKQYDYRHPNYFQELKDAVTNLDIEANVAFLGFIDREDQLSLISSSLAVIQPSLFEGWSTVIEDAKSLKVNIIASNINVHKEQLKAYPSSSFFNTDDSFELSSNMVSLVTVNNYYNYAINITEFGKNFIEIVNSV